MAIIGILCIGGLVYFGTGLLFDIFLGNKK